MPNIYLRLSTSRCQFFRHRDQKHPLAPSDPVVFNSYMTQFFIMQNSLTNAQAVTQRVNDQCYSHQQWRNMMCGYAPTGGKNVILQRDKDEYLTFDEIQQLNGKREYDKTSSVDYLCIKLPYEVQVVDTVRAVTPSWNLDTRGIRDLVSLLNNDFKRHVVEWALATFDFVTSNNRVLVRAQTAQLERFLMRYEIEPTETEKDNLRRVIERWLRAEHSYFSAYSCLDMKYLDSSEKQHHIDRFQWL